MKDGKEQCKREMVELGRLIVLLKGVGVKYGNRTVSSFLVCILFRSVSFFLRVISLSLESSFFPPLLCVFLRAISFVSSPFCAL